MTRNRTSAIPKFFAPVLFSVCLIIILAVWFQGAVPEIRSDFVAGPLVAFGRLTGLLAFYLILWQLLIIGRISWIERYWGHDKLSRLHHIVGIVAVSILIAHPLLLIAGYSKVAQTTLIQQALLFTFSYPDILRAVAGYIMFLVIVGASLYTVSKHLRYETWYFVHATLYLAVIFAFGHQLTNGHDLVSGGSFSVFWQILFWGTLANVVWYRVLIPVRNYRKYQFYVSDIRRENPTVVSIVITGRGMDGFKAKAGQFVKVIFFTKGFWWESHPFSLSEMPNGQRLRLTVKAIGDYTSKIADVPLNTRVVIEGPLGIFTADRAKRDKVALIAGGIGITPLRSLFEKFSEDGRQVDLIYAAKSEHDFALRTELEALSNDTAKVHYIPEDRGGRLTKGLISTALPDISERFVYLCGPVPMMKAVKDQLVELGVPNNMVLYEKFRLG